LSRSTRQQRYQEWARRHPFSALGILFCFGAGVVTFGAVRSNANRLAMNDGARWIVEILIVAVAALFLGLVFRKPPATVAAGERRPPRGPLRASARLVLLCGAAASIYIAGPDRSSGQYAVAPDIQVLGDTAITIFGLVLCAAALTSIRRILQGEDPAVVMAPRGSDVPTPDQSPPHLDIFPTSPPPLPDDPQFASSLKGYDPRQVDAFIARAQRCLKADPRSPDWSSVSAHDARLTTFRLTLSGYNVDQVDEYLERVAVELEKRGSARPA
jgi:DivIVA domain-containing protein